MSDLLNGHNASPAATLRTQSANLQTQELQALIGTSSNTNQPSGSLIDLGG